MSWNTKSQMVLSFLAVLAADVSVADVILANPDQMPV